MGKLWVILFVWGGVGSKLARYSVEDCRSNITTIIQAGKNFTYRFDQLHRYSYAFFGSLVCNVNNCSEYLHRTCTCSFRIGKCWCQKEIVQVDTNYTLTIVQPAHSTVYFIEYQYRTFECLFLHVIDVQIYSKTIPGYVEEGGGFVLKATSPVLNYTSTTNWDISNQSLGGLGYIVTSNSLEVRETSREMNNMVISYTVEENNNTASFDYEVKIAYGPDRYLKFSPDQTFYNVDVGDDLGIIECSVDCNPSCDISWFRPSSNTTSNGSLLTLGTVTTAMDGEYICTATRAGTSQIAKMSLYVVVKGKQSLLVTVGLVGSGCCLAAVAMFIVLKGIQMLKKILKKQDVSSDQEQTTETRKELPMNYSSLQRSVQASQDQYSSLEREEAFYEPC